MTRAITVGPTLATGRMPRCRLGVWPAAAPRVPIFRPYESGTPIEVQPPTLDDIEAYRTSSTGWANVPWGNISWPEALLGGTILHQQLDIDIPSTPAPEGGHPVLLYFHANGTTKAVAPGSSNDLYAKQPALANGVAFIAVEFRHPVANEDQGSPHLDAGLAIQYVRSLAPALNLNPNHFYALCRSRGNLALWQSVQPDMANAYAGTYAGRQSSRLQGIHSMSGQIAFSVHGFCNLFIDPADHAAVLAENPDNPAWLDAIDAVPTVDVLPQLMMVHDDAWFGAPISKALLESSGVSVVHFPDAGRVMTNAYAARGMAARISAYDAEPSANEQLRDIVPWILGLIEGMDSREAAAMARALRRGAQAHYVTDDLVGIAQNSDGSGAPVVNGPIGAVVAGQHGRANRALGVAAQGYGAGQNNALHKPLLDQMASGHYGLRFADATDRLVVGMPSDGTPNWVGWTLTGEVTTLAAQTTASYTMGQTPLEARTLVLSIGSDEAISANDMKLYRNFASVWAGINYP